MSLNLILVFLVVCISGELVFGETLSRVPRGSGDDDAIRALIKYKLITGNGTYAEADNLVELPFQPGKELHMFIPGDYSSNYYQVINGIFFKAYQNMTFNFVFVDLSLNKNLKVSRAISMGESIGKAINELNEKNNIVFERIMTQGRGPLVVSGVAIAAEPKLKRIIVLDGFADLLKMDDSEKLTKDSAEVVEFIHTSAPQFGISLPMGHRDFYINGGISPQPPCKKKCASPYCSTRIAILYYFRAFLNRDSSCYIARQCTDQESFVNGTCDLNLAVKIYNSFPNTVQGTFYWNTHI